MRIFLSFAFVLAFALSVVPAQAAENSVDGPVKEEKVLNNKRNYTAKDLSEQDVVEENTLATEESVVTKSQECTAEDRIKIDEYNNVMASYYQDVKFIKENVDKFETTKELEILQQNSKVYMGFISSPEYPAYLRMLERCHEAPPPLPFDWPQWMLGTNPLTNADR